MVDKKLIELFWSKVEITSSCWNFKSTSTGGYGYFHVNRKKHQAHRFAYELLEGKIPNGMTIDHLCQNRSCVNPAHMDIVTIKENVMRGIGITATQARRNTCDKGHLLEGHNLIILKRQRRCRICHNERCRLWNQKKVIAHRL